jgi:FkbM family methyltransferase
MNIYSLRKFSFNVFYGVLKLAAMATGTHPEDREYYRKYFRFLSFFGVSFAYTLGDRRVVYDPHRSAIGWNIFFDGGFEREELDLCAQFITPESTVLDIGANIGIHSIWFSTLANNGRVISFEPSRSTFSLLLENVKDIGNIIPLNTGISDTSGIFTFYECDDNALSGLKDTLRSPVARRTSIVCHRGDDIVASLHLDKVDFIKIDVEGLEKNVLDGLRQTIDAHRPIIFCEIYAGSNSNSDPSGTVQFVIDMGYDAFVLAGTNLKPFTTHNDDEHNYLFVPSRTQHT